MVFIKREVVVDSCLNQVELNPSVFVLCVVHRRAAHDNAWFFRGELVSAFQCVASMIVLICWGGNRLYDRRVIRSKRVNSHLQMSVS